MPARPRTALAVAALVTVGGLVAGCGSTSGSTTSGSSPTGPSAATTTAAATPGAGSSSTAPAPAASSAGTARASARPGTAPGGSAAAPAAAASWVADPEKAGYEFGFVWGAKRSGDSVVLTFDRAGMLVGDRAKAYYDAHPAEERFDYKILNDKSFTETLRVPASATLYGNQLLGPRNGARNTRIDLDRLAARTSGGDRGKVAVWLQRTGKGPVVYLAEQYLP
jgi:hypothetical protein